MEKTVKFDTIKAYNDFNNHETFHPLVTIIDFSKANPRTWGKDKKVRVSYGFYCIFLKEIKCGDLKYGCHYYDYQEGTLVFMAPGQVMDIENNGEVYQPIGHGLMFHADLLKGTSLAKGISDYHFFSYHSNEALHLSERERQIVLDCFSKIEFELHQGVDKHSKKLISTNIELFLDYCQRFYDRQFITRENTNKGILARFEEILNDYFQSEKPQRIGIPSVAYCAAALNLSANYFGDLIKKETGTSAKDYILNKIIDTAKTKVFDKEKTINEIAYELGFKYPQHFMRLFKDKVGHTPTEYRGANQVL
jgi:AraC-like DNA-binding protein